MAARKKKNQPPKRLFKRGTTLAVPPGAEVVYNPPGHEKMSDVLEDFIEPFRDLADGLEEYRKLLSLALIAWNFDLLTKTPGSETLDELLETLLHGVSKEDRAAAAQLIDLMIQRKRDYFAANKRLILSFELTDRGRDFHLQVMSTLDEPAI